MSHAAGVSGEMEEQYLNSCFKGEKGIPRIAHLEDASKSVFSQVTDLQNFEIWRDRAKIELSDENIIDDYWRLGGLIQSLCE